MRRLSRTILLLLPAALLLALLAPAPASAQMFGGNEASAELFVRQDGDTVRAAIQIRIHDGWHLYHSELGHPDAIGAPTTVAFGAGEGVTWGAVRFPKPDKLSQEDVGGPGVFILSHHGTITLYAEGKLDAGASLGEVTATIDGLTCKDTCIPYAETVTSAGPGADAVFAGFSTEPGADGERGPPPTSAGGARKAAALTQNDPAYDAVEFDGFTPREDAAERSLGLWLLFAFLAGAILNVMPCVLPVISIKVLSFVQQAGEDRKRIFQLGLAFSAGILGVFVALGAVAAGLGIGWGEQFQSQAFLISMIAVVFGFSLSLFGVFEVGALGQGLAGVGQREGLGDAFFKGVLATLLATPCSGPFLGSTLAWALAQPTHVILAVFGTMGVGMAFPYVILTANPAFLRLLPRPGAWMETFKQGMGFLLVATCLWLLISVNQDLLLFTFAALLAVGVGCWIYGRYASFDQSWTKWSAVTVLSVAVAGGGSWAAFGPMQASFQPGANHALWEEFEPDTFARYQAEGRNVFVDFTADWCANCKFNEKTVYESEEARALFKSKRVVVLKADMTTNSKKTAMLARFRDSLGARSVPFMALFPGDAPREPYTRHALVGKEDFLKLLTSLP